MAKVDCAEHYPELGDRYFRLKTGEEALTTVARDVFPNLKVGDFLDTKLFGYYAAQ